MSDFNQTSHPDAPETAPIQQPATRSPRDGHDGKNGRFLAGNRESLQHGAFSEQVRNALTPEQAEALAVLAEKRAEIERDLGGVENLSVLARDLASRYLELCTVADYLGGKLVTQGPLTPKGNQRAALSAYLGVVDRLHRLAMALGLERRAKPIHPLDAVRKAVEEENRS